MTKLRNFSTEWKQEIADTSEVAGAITNQTKVRYQIKTLPSNITSNTSDITSLKFNNLTIGKRYRVTIQGSMIMTNNNFRTVIMFATHNSQNILSVSSGSANTGNAVEYKSGSSIVFTATTTVITFGASFTNPSGGLVGDGTTFHTFSMLEELPNHEVTTQWT